MTTAQFFEKFLSRVMETPHWKVMEGTVEDSPWHREANVAVHTLMTIDAYMNKFYADRSESERMLTLITLLFHDFGKPEAEETVEKKDQPGVMYRRYAGHEPVSANEFFSFMCEQHELREMLFEQGFTWIDLRKIKFMIEHHLPYGLKNEQKRKDLRVTVAYTLGDEEECFFDMLRSDSAGRISDDHEQKLKNVEDWIGEFRHVQYDVQDPYERLKNRLVKEGSWGQNKYVRQPTLYVMYGVSGAGKSTYIDREMPETEVFSEDELRLEHFRLSNNEEVVADWNKLSKAEQYDVAWKFCHLNPDSGYDAFMNARFNQALARFDDLVLDRMNQGKKARGKFITAAKQKGYRIQSVEFYVSEQTAKDRQKTRGDKALPDFRVHQIYMSQELPWYGAEVDGIVVVGP